MPQPSGGSVLQADGADGPLPSSVQSTGALPGSPSLPFQARCNLLWSQQAAGAWMVLAFSAIIIFRCWRLLTLPTATWVLASLLGSMATLAWQHRRPASFVRWRELPAVLLRLNSFGPWAAWLLMRQLLDDHGPPPAGASWYGALAEVAVHLAHLVFASGAAKMAANALSLRVRFSLSVAVQMALVLASMGHTALLCTSTPLAHPSGQRMTRQLYQAVAAAASLAAIPMPAFAKPQSAVEECIAVLAWLRVSISLLVPLLWEAFALSRLFKQHQAERRQAGLPPERGLRAGFYHAVQMVNCGDSALHIAMVAWLLLAVSWDWVAVILVPLYGRAWGQAGAQAGCSGGWPPSPGVCVQP